MKLNTLLLFLLTLTSTLSAQEASVHVDHTSFLAIDENRFLVLDQSDGLRLVDANGTQLYRHSEQLMADITTVDITTALRPMLFFGGVPAFQVLDNTLSPQTSAIRLQDFDMPDVTMICPAVDNGYWVYDAVSFEIKRVDEQLNVQVTTGGTNVVIGKVLDVVSMHARNNRLFVLDRESGIHVFDFYGGYLGLLLSENEVTYFDIREDRLIYSLKDNTVFSATLIKSRSGVGLLPHSSVLLKSARPITGISIVGEIIFVGDGKKITSVNVK